MKIFIAGGTGFVGAAVVRALAAHELVLPARRPPAEDQRYVPFSGDLAALVQAARPDIVINLLGIIRETGGETFELVHAEYTRRLLAGAKACGVKKFIQMSALGASQGSPSVYQRTKFEGEEVVRASGLPWVIFRPSFITGEGQKLRAELEALAAFAPFFAAPSDSFVSPVDVETVAACFARAAVSAEINNELFELAGERTVSFRELLSGELSAAGIRRPVIGLPRSFFWPLLPVFSLLPKPPMTHEQYLMLGTPNTLSGKYRGVGDLLG